MFATSNWNNLLKGKPAIGPLVAVAALAFASAGCDQSPQFGPVANSRTAESIREALSEGSSAGGNQVVAPVGTGWATIRGRFVFDGAPPQMPPYGVTSEHNICAPGGQPPLQETLLVDSGSGGIKNVAVYLRSAARVHESAAAKSEPIPFDQKACVFLSHVVAMTVGQPLEIMNSDPTGHNTKISGAKNTFNQTIESGTTIAYVPQQEEAIPAPVACSIHPWMSAYILPRENAYVAITSDDGSFEIANVPAGEEIEFQVWHESGASPGSGLVGATPDAPELKWSNRGRFTVTLQPDEVKEVQVVVGASAFKG